MINNTTRIKKVFVAMSGGVDSSVAAGMMKEAGYDVVGVTMCFNISHTGDKKPSCCGVDGIEDAKRAANILGIPHYVLNFAEEINEMVINNFTSEYLSGRTPNPCVRCNQHLKFGSLLQRAIGLGADYLATGHYANIVYNQQKQHYELKKGKDANKDQSYFLYAMRKEALPKVLFPLGGFQKEQVRELARKYRLNNAEKPASQDICFIPAAGYRNFLEDRLGSDAFRPGPFQDQSGAIVGEHKGLAFYTIGQREKLGLALGQPVYVYRIEQETNTVFVGPSSQLYSRGLIADDANFLCVGTPIKNLKITAQVRYNSQEIDAHLTSIAEDAVRVDFLQPQKAITPGQSVVFYQGDVVLGGAVIREPIERQDDSAVLAKSEKM